MSILLPAPILALHSRINWPITLNTTAESSDFAIGPAGTARMTYQFGANGGITVHRLAQNDNTITPWNDNYPFPERDYYVLLTYSSGDVMNVGYIPPTGWLKISGSGALNPQFGLTVTGNFENDIGTIIASISPDSDGARVVSAASFRVQVEVEL